MEATRLDNPTFAKATADALSHIEQAMALLAPHLVIITAEERRAMLKPGEGFISAARSLCRASREQPAMSTVAGFDPEAVEEDLANVDSLAPLIEKLTEFSQRTADSRLVWLAEAYVPSLALYSMAKTMAKQNGALRTILAPLAQIFTTPRTRKEEESSPAEPTK